MYSSYYQAQVVLKFCWALTATLRSFENVAFDRALTNKSINKEINTFEFFVPKEQEPVFLEIMNFFQKEGIIKSFTKLPNRLKDPNQEF